MFLRSAFSGRSSAALRSFRAALAGPTALVIAALGWLAATPAQALAPAPMYYWGGFAGKSGSPGFLAFFQTGVGSEYTLGGPQGLAVDASDGAIYVANTGDHTILKVLPNGTVTTIAGTTGNPGSTDSPSFFPTFRQPYGVAVDANHILYVADFGNGRVRKLAPSGNTYTVSTVKQGLTNISAIAATPTGTLYVISNGVLSTMNGTVNNPAVTDITDSLLFIPAGLAVDSSNGDLYIADRSYHTIVKRTSAGVFSLVAGSQADPGFVDATGAAAKFNTPLAVAVDPVTKNVYVTDSTNHAIRKIDSNGVVTTMGGGVKSTGENGIGANAGFQSLSGVALGRNREIYAIDNITGAGGRVTRGVDVNGAISLAAPTAAAPYGSSFPVTFTLPGTAVAGSVKLYLDDGLGSVFRCTFSTANETAGLHSFTINSLNPIGSTGGNVTVIDRLRVGPSIPASSYTATLEYTDSATGKPVFTLPTAGVVIDTAPPVFAETRYSVDPPLEATSPNGAALIFDEGVSDPLSGVNASTVSFMRGDYNDQNKTPVHSGDFFPVGSWYLDLSATDNVGNVGTKQIYVLVQDTTPPTATAPATITVMPGADGYAQVGDLTGQVTAQDVATATPDIVITQDISQYQFLPVGRYPIKFTARDGAYLTKDVTSTLVVAFPAVTTPALAASKAAGPVVKTVSLGAAVPGAGANGIPAGATFGTFFTPALADTRMLVARATVLDGKKLLPAIYQEDSGGTGRIVAIAGGKVEPTNANSTVVWASFLDPLIGPDSGIAVVAKVADASVTKNDDEGLWTNALPFYYDTAPLIRVLQEGHDIGIGTGITLKSITSASVRKQEIISLVKLAGTGVTKTNDTALIRQATEAMTGLIGTASLLRTGDTPAGLGAKVLGISAFMPTLFSIGQGRTHADGGIAARVTTDTKGDVLVLIADDGTVHALLSTIGTDAFPNAQATKLSLPDAAGTGVAAKITAKFLPSTKATDAIVFSKTISAFTHSLAVGATIPAGGATFTKLSDPVVNDTPSAVFLATTSAKAPANTALYAWAADYTLREIVHTGASATDADGSALAGTVTWKSFKNYALPDASGVVFVADLNGKDAAGKALTAGSKLGLWAEDAAHKLRLLLRGDQDVTVGGVTKKLATFRLLDTLPGSFGSRRSYNSAKSVAVLATFTDKSQALVRVDIP